MNERRRAQRAAAAAAARGSIEDEETQDEPDTVNSVSNGPVNGRPAPAGDPQPPIMADFETDNGTDASDVTAALREIKVHFDEADIEFFFTQFEMMMENAGVKSQWTKRCQLYRFLPPQNSE